MIKWIIFDQGGVLTYPIFSQKENYSIKNKKYSAKELEEIFYIPEYKYFSVGKFEEKKLIRIFLERKNFNELTVDEYIDLLKKGIEPTPGMNELLETLSKKYNLATLINEGKEWADYKLDIPKFRIFFKKNIISGYVGLKKPNKDFFFEALKLLNAKPEECIFIDNEKQNIIAAKELGFKTILFTDSKKLVKDFSILGIKK
jgi:putative hydrolase of the HAD superfamily